MHVSDLLGSPAYVPRLSGVLDLPTDTSALADAASLYLGDAETEKSVYDAANVRVYAAGTDPNLPELPASGDDYETPDRRSGLWDVDWTDMGYSWTVVPAIPHILGDGSTVEYQDVAFGEDHSQSGESLPFGEDERARDQKALWSPVRLGPDGLRRPNRHQRDTRLLRPAHRRHLAPGTRRDDLPGAVERKAYPFGVVGSKKVLGTHALLTLPNGTWYYRVRGIDATIPSTQQGMTWSDPQYVRLLARTFFVG